MVAAVDEDEEMGIPSRKAASRRLDRSPWIRASTLVLSLATLPPPPFSLPLPPSLTMAPGAPR